MRSGETIAKPTSPAAGNGTGRDAAAANAALRAAALLLAGSPAPQALFDDGGRCVAASLAFTRRAGVAADAAGRLDAAFVDAADTRDVVLGGETYRLVTLPPESAATPPASDGGAIPPALRAVLDALPAAVSVRNREGRVVFANALHAQLFGPEPERAATRNPARKFGARERRAAAELDRQVIETGTIAPFAEQGITGADGQLRHVLAAKLPLPAPGGGEIAGAVTVALDITERKRHEKQLLETKITAEAASQAKTLFLAQLSHELRNPLNAIIGFTEMMAQKIFGPLGAPQYGGYAEDVLKAARHVLGILIDMLDVTRLEAGAQALDLARVPAGEIVAETGRIAAPHAANKRIVLRQYVGAGLPDLRADPRRLRQALVNLVFNAVKVTPEGGTVSFGAFRTGEGGVELAVEDSRVGIPQAEVETALLALGREGYARAQEASGIGVPLAKALIELHGGRVVVDRAGGRGTRIRAIFPPVCCVADEGFGVA